MTGPWAVGDGEDDWMGADDPLAAFPDLNSDAGEAGRMPAGGDAGRMAHAGGPDQHTRLTVWVRGRVQGVGFRWWVRSVALELGLAGMAENLVDGRVKVVAEGDSDRCAMLLERLEGPGTPGRVVQVTYRWDQPRGDLTGFAER